MSTRLFITLLALTAGLSSFGVEWNQRFQTPPTLWFQSMVIPNAELTNDVSLVVLDTLRSKESDCNHLYVAYLKERRARMVARWSPLEPLEIIISQHNPGLGRYSCSKIAEAILDCGERYHLDPFLIAALIAQESRFRPGCVSPGGAVGLGQLLPSTAASLGVNPYDASQNVEGCARYLSTQMRRWQSSPDKVALALASYNAGPGAVQKYGGVPPYRITQNYVAKITARQQRFVTQAQKSKKQWIAANGPVMKDLYGKSLFSGSAPNPKA